MISEEKMQEWFEEQKQHYLNRLDEDWQRCCQRRRYSAETAQILNAHSEESLVLSGWWGRVTPQQILQMKRLLGGKFCLHHTDVEDKEEGKVVRWYQHEQLPGVILGIEGKVSTNSKCKIVEQVHRYHTLVCPM